MHFHQSIVCNQNMTISFYSYYEKELGVASIYVDHFIDKQITRSSSNWKINSVVSKRTLKKYYRLNSDEEHTSRNVTVPDNWLTNLRSLY